MRTTAERLFAPVMVWTAITGIFAWLPLVRIAGRPEGYHWGVLGLSGEGTDGPFWIFVLLTAYVVAMLFTTVRGPRRVAYVLVPVWHALLTGVVIAGVVAGGTGATWQGQGLRWEIPLWILIVPFATVLALSAAWVVVERRNPPPPPPPTWSRSNNRRLAASALLLAIALFLFGRGTNYDGVTALAIVATIAHWILLIESFAAGRPRST